MSELVSEYGRQALEAARRELDRPECDRWPYVDQCARELMAPKWPGNDQEAATLAAAKAYRRRNGGSLECALNALNETRNQWGKV